MRSSSSVSGSSSLADLRKRVAVIDTPLAYSLALLLLVYMAVTLLTYNKISSRAKDNSDSRGLLPNEEYKAYDSLEELRHTFPIHVGTDTEIIPHPGLTLAVDTSKVPADLSRTMVVPKFFEDSHGHLFPGGSIRKFLGNWGERLMTPEEAMSIGSLDNEGHETIYCSIASYRDPECHETVEDLYARAMYPDRIRVAILDQRADGDLKCASPSTPCEQNPDQAFCKYRHLMDVYEMDARLAIGPVFARHLAHRHYRGEYFAMQIDSHVRFTQDWDEDIINQWKSAHNEMAVLSTYLSDLKGSINPITHKSLMKTRPLMCNSDYEGNGDYKHLRHGQQPELEAGITGQPTLHPFWAAGFSFARGHFVIQVPYDQYLPMVFQGEEISIGLRAFTYGYDFYAAERSVCFHMYADENNPNDKRNKIPLFWENSNTYNGVGMRAMKRLNNIIGMAKHPSTDYQHDNEEKYGLGKARKTQRFFDVFGIHTDTQTVEGHLCRFVGRPMMKVFLPALRSNRMGIDYDKIDYRFKDPDPPKDN